jgi:prepilin-type N-terminal cleavage/methylation domain-containing protein
MRSNKGFTLIEILVAVSILAIIAAGLSMTINTILKTYNIARDQSIAMRQVENAGHWLNQDLQNIDNPPNLNGFPFPLDIDCYSGAGIASTEAVSYQLENVNDNIRLTRTVEGGDNVLVADYLDLDNTSITTLTDEATGDRYYELTIAAVYESKQAKMTYVIKPRVQ